MNMRRDSGQFIWGIVLLVLGLVFLLNSFGYLWFGWDRWWAIILIVIGVAMLYRRKAPAEPPASGSGGTAVEPSIPAPPAPTIRRRFPTGAILLIGVGLAFLLENVIGGQSFPALVLIAIGVALLLRDRAQR